MKKENLISFELAKTLDDLDIELPYWCNSGFHYRIEGGEATDGYFMGNSYKASLLHDIQKWLREIHKINIEIIGFVDSLEENICYYYHLRDMTKYSTLLILPDSDENTFDSYEKCLEESLLKSLTLIK
jgi:hypothetical protein